MSETSVVEIICGCGNGDFRVWIEAVNIDKHFGRIPIVRCQCSVCGKWKSAQFPCLNPNLTYGLRLVAEELEEHFWGLTETQQKSGGE